MPGLVTSTTIIGGTSKVTGARRGVSARGRGGGGAREGPAPPRIDLSTRTPADAGRVTAADTSRPRDGER